MHGSAEKPSSQPTGTMHVMDGTGHSSVTWDINIPEEVNMARDAFDRMIRAGYSAFEVEGKDQQGKRVTTFDPRAGKLMMVPHHRGG